MMRLRYGLLLLLLAFSGGTPLYADMALLLQQPHSTFGFFNPTGHASVYLSKVCAESPVRLRRCDEGESGVVISRYNKVAGYDWVAIPLIPYMYAVDHPDEVPDSIDRAGVLALRDAWRRGHLRDLAPDVPDVYESSDVSDVSDVSDSEESAIPKGDWTQLVGAAYDRKIYGFLVETDESSDDALIEILNARGNKRRFNLLFNNCADFAKKIVNFYYPKAVRRSFIADIGITTPKHIAKSFVKFNRRNPELRSITFMIPQVDGELARSNAVRGVAETIILSKKYVVPLVIASPWALVGGVVIYVTDGRFNPEKYVSVVLDPVELEEYLGRWSLTDH
jgi:hypothetical protein